MHDEHDLSFVIPTHHSRDVGETVEQYDEHFWRNEHSPHEHDVSVRALRRSGEVEISVVM